MSYLVRKKVDGSAAEFWDLSKQPLLIVGRGEQAQARTNDPEMSRQHFKITSAKDKYALQDLQSRNGTFVNGAKVTETDLKPGDEIRAGESIFLFSTTHGSEPTAGQTIIGHHSPRILKKG